jgi:hypothetical protein
MFAAKEIQKKDILRAKSDRVGILDAKRANNCGIMLSRFKDINYKQLCDAIMRIDEKILTPDNATALLDYIPTKEEAKALTEYQGPKEKLTSAEKYFLELLKIPFIEERLRCIHFKVTFEEEVQSLQPNIQAVLLACQQVRTSSRLRRLMEIILALGNYMNGGGFRGGAYGFTLDTLTKIKDTKTVDNKKNLMHYLAIVLQRDYPDVFNFAEELPQVKHAARSTFRFSLHTTHDIHTSFCVMLCYDLFVNVIFLIYPLLFYSFTCGNQCLSQQIEERFRVGRENCRRNE